MFRKKGPSVFQKIKIVSGPFLLVLFVAAVFVLIVVVGPKPYKGIMQVGDAARRTIKAPFDFYVQGDIDVEATAKNRRAAEEKVADIYVPDKAKNESMSGKIGALFNESDLLRGDAQLSLKEKAALLKEKSPVDLKSAHFNYLLSAEENEFTALKEVIVKTLGLLKQQPIFDDAQKTELVDKTDVISYMADGIKEIKETASLLSASDAVLIAREYISGELDNKDAQLTAEGIISEVISGNVSFEEKLTKKRKEEAVKSAEIVYEQNLIKENSIIVAESQLVTKDHIAYLSQLSKIERENEGNEARLYYYYGVSLLILLLTALFWAYLNLYEPQIASSANSITLLGLLSFLVILSAKLITFSPLSRYFIPLASASILIAMLLSSRLAIIATVFLSIFIAIIYGGQAHIFIFYLVGGLTGIYSVKNVRRRAQLLKAGLFIGLTSCLAIINIDLMDNLGLELIFKDSLWAISGGFASAFIVTGILPVLEYIFKTTTNISLLELSDLNHPLLKEMVIRAPGTYHHSLIVGNLAEYAADAIGANSLLARVGAYYHDIGKLLKPEYFSENQMGYSDKHAELTPKMSSLIITNHIKDGLELARKHKLSFAIRDFIQQHHGNSITFYFYQRAVEIENKDGDVKEEDFRYKSPLPQTKEVAIVLLADAVEAATRALPSQTPKKIKHTVQKIINNRFIDGQLDECDLSLKDLHGISESFSKLLAGIYHSRVEYPDLEKEGQSSKKNKSQNGLKNKPNQ